MKFLDDNGLLYLWAKINAKFLKQDTVNTMIENAIKTAKLDSHPIGSYYWSKNSTNPSELFGGTWERVKDTFLYALGDEGIAGETGGNSSIKLTKEQIPTLTGTSDISHVHDKVNINGMETGLANGSKQGSIGLMYSWDTAGSDIRTDVSTKISSEVNITNDNQIAIDISPTHIKAYCWERIA